MPLQPPNYFGLVDPTNPVGTDSRTISDDYHRMALASMQQQAPNWAGAITASHTDINTLTGAAALGKPMVGVGGTTVVYFYNATVPPGWTLNQPDTNLRNLTIAGSGDTGGTISGNIDPSAATLSVNVVNVSVDLPANTGNYALTTADVPNLNYQSGRATTCTGGDVKAFSSALCGGENGWDSSAGITKTTTGGGGGAHSHTIGGTALQTGGSGAGSTATFNPRRAVGVLGTLNA